MFDRLPPADELAARQRDREAALYADEAARIERAILEAHELRAARSLVWPDQISLPVTRALEAKGYRVTFDAASDPRRTYEAYTRIEWGPR